ncbi:MAG: helix-turn-helix domain-containing protein, partial [Verrucomicrobiota bacterium]
GISISSDKNPLETLNCFVEIAPVPKGLKMSNFKQNLPYSSAGLERNGGKPVDKSAAQMTRWEELAAAAQYKPATIATLTQVSLRTLQRHFRKEYDMTISQWLRAIRLREAYSRLRMGQTVKEVSYGLGYKQLSHFSREFKRMYGVAPSCITGNEHLNAGELIKNLPTQGSIPRFWNAN